MFVAFDQHVNHPLFLSIVGRTTIEDVYIARKYSQLKFNRILCRNFIGIEADGYLKFSFRVISLKKFLCYVGGSIKTVCIRFTCLSHRVF